MSRRRWRSSRWVRMCAAGAGAFLLTSGLLGLLLMAAVVEPDDGAEHAVLGRLEREIRKNEALHYELHMGLGRLFSLCPCTQGRAAAEFGKASFHAPRPTPEGAWGACRLAAVQRLAGRGVVIADLPDGADAERPVTRAPDGVFATMGLLLVRDGRGDERLAEFLCEARFGSDGRWSIQALDISEIAYDNEEYLRGF